MIRKTEKTVNCGESNALLDAIALLTFYSNKMFNREGSRSQIIVMPMSSPQDYFLSVSPFMSLRTSDLIPRL